MTPPPFGQFDTRRVRDDWSLRDHDHMEALNKCERSCFGCLKTRQSMGRATREVAMSIDSHAVPGVAGGTTDTHRASRPCSATSAASGNLREAHL